MKQQAHVQDKHINSAENNGKFAQQHTCIRQFAQEALPLSSHQQATSSATIGMHANRDFSGVPVHAENPSSETQAGQAAGSVSFKTPPAKAPAPPPAKPAVTPATLTVDKIDVIDSAAGAIGGFPAITSGDLNSPGPFNNPATGGVSNVHQIHFHLDNGSSADLTPTRIVRGSNWFAGVESKHPADQVMPPGVSGPPALGGFGGVMDAPDGPAAHEIKRPATDSIVVADAPGVTGLATASYPYRHQSTFNLTVAGPGGVAVASIRYGVEISKTSAKDVPNTRNAISSIEKKDLVRGKTL